MLIDLIIYTPMYVTGFWALVLMLSSGRKNRAKKMLGIFMLLAFSLYISHALFFQKQYTLYIYFDPVYTLAGLSVYPLYYWYIKLLTVDPKFNLRNLVMFIPAVVLCLATALVYLLMTPAESKEYLFGMLFHTKPLKMNSNLIQIQHYLFIISRIVFTIQIFVFLILGRKLVLRYNKRIANFYSNLESKTLVWVKLLLYSFFATSVMSIVFNVLGRSTFSESMMLLIIPSVIFSVLLFFIGFQGYMQNHTVNELVEDELGEEEISLKDYNMSQLKDKLLELFENQKIYKQSDLKINQVSVILQTNRTYVSGLINTEFKCSFNEFVNRYRVAEAKELLQEKNQANYTLDYVSDEAGFGSLSSFIRIFREMEGITPGRYKAKHARSNQEVKS